MSRLIVSLNFEIESKLLKVPQICLKCHCAPFSQADPGPATDVKLNSISTNHLFFIITIIPCFSGWFLIVCYQLWNPILFEEYRCQIKLDINKWSLPDKDNHSMFFWLLRIKLMGQFCSCMFFNFEIRYYLNNSIVISKIYALTLTLNVEPASNTGRRAFEPNVIGSQWWSVFDVNEAAIVPKSFDNLSKGRVQKKISGKVWSFTKPPSDP